MSDQPVNIRETEDEVMDWSQDKRRWIIDQMLKDGKLPEDPAEKKVILSALDGMDKAALGKKRLKIEEKTNATQEQAAAIIAKILAGMSTNKPTTVQNTLPKAAPVLGPEIPNPVLVEGETSVDAVQQTYTSFLASIPSTGNAR